MRFRSILMAGALALLAVPAAAQTGPRTAAEGPRLVSMTLRGTRLPDALARITREAGVQLAYAPDEIPAYPVFLELEDVPVEVAVRRMIAGMPLTVATTPSGILVIRTVPSDQQQRPLTIRGRITDPSGRPLAGAQVAVRGTGIGTLSDRDGEYTIVVPQPEGETVVEVTYIGYGEEAQTVRQTSGIAEVDFVLSIDALQLDELVVTGVSAATEKRQLGNAISTLGVRELDETGSPALDRALSGKVAGALVQQNSGNPAGGVSVRLRGTGTILGDADPLYIVDGVIVNNDSPELLYLGGYTQNRLVDLNPADIERVEIVKGAAAAALYGSRANNGVVQIFTKRGTVGRGGQMTYSTRFITESVRKTLEVNEYPYDAAGNPVQRYDHQDVIFRRAYGTEQYLSVTGGTEETRYFASGSYLGSQGIVDGVRFDRATGRVRVDQQLGGWLSVSLGGSYFYSHNNEVPNGGLGALYGALDGFIFGPNTYDARPDPVTGEYSDAGAFANPAEVIDKYDFQQTTDRFIGDLHLLATPVRGLELDYTFGYDGYTQEATGFIPRGTATPSIYAYGWSRRAARQSLHVNNDLTARYRRSLLPGLQSTTLVGGTVQYERPQTISVWSYDLTPVSKVATSGANQSMSDYRSERLIAGVFAQQTVGLADRLFLTAAGRVDASSVFSEEERWQFYPKASASYLFSDAPFWNGFGLDRWLPTFKARASWGQSGGLTAIGPYDRFTTYSPVSYESRPALIPDAQQGGMIKPERQSELELGLDFSPFSNRFAVEFTWYRQHTEDLLLTRQIAPSTGYSTRLENVGKIDNEGVELLLRAVPIDRPGLRWSSTVTYAANRNEVSGIPGGVRVLAGTWGLAAAMNGEPLGVYFAWGYARDANGNILDTEGNVYTDPSSQVPARSADKLLIGDPTPDFTASMINEVDIGRRLSLRAQLDAVQGNDIWNYTRRIGAYPPYGTLKDYEQELSGEIAAGTGRALWLNFEHWVEDGSFVKLRELSATYLLATDLYGLQSVRLSLIGRNLFSIDDYTGYDPEVNAGGQRTGTRGYEFVEVPIPRSLSIGLTANF